MTIFGYNFLIAKETWYWWLFMITTHINVLIAVGFTTQHCWKTALDLLSKQRKSVKFRQSVPKLSTPYVMIGVLLCISLILFTSSISLAGVHQWKMAKDHCSIYQQIWHFFLYDCQTMHVFGIDSPIAHCIQ